MSTETLDQVIGALRDLDGGVAAAEVGNAIGASRVTARRYLEHLADSGRVVRRVRYGSRGRPEILTRWRECGRLPTR
ncbi:FaeA/PapI family transcriptional regulator [Yimella sp. cx-51]|uniref:FaeA/PapI family transcriptional regulator n=1 Tax=Yimella sp. cx-51 TaxID=2770551 RepID=UPI00351C4171